MRSLTARPVAAWWMLAALTLAFQFFASPNAAAAPREPRLALVIANSAYANFDRLGGTYGDGDKIAAALTGVGFVDAAGSGPVAARRDLGRADMVAQIAAFKDKLAAAGPKAFGVLYFSGHGAALGSYGDVMLLPVDAGANLAGDAEALSRATVTKTLLKSGGRTILIVLDMCRSVLSAPPVATPTTSGAAPSSVTSEAIGAKGLRRLTRQSELASRPDQGFLVAFSTSPDQVAFDDGVFSKVLAEEIRRPQQNMADALKRVSDRVAMRPGPVRQKPTFDYGLQGDPPCFVSCDPGAGTDRFFDCASCPYMRVVAAGDGVVGSPASEPGRGRDEPLQAKVSIAHPFALGVFDVTVAEWKACVLDGACRPVGDWSKENPNPLIPASDISFEDAQAYIAWLTVQSGLAYRLPTEAEWEYAARAGATTAFAFGDDITPSQANYDQTASYHGSPTAPYRGYPEAVNAYPPNAFGLFQMQGNVWQWTDGCADAGCGRRIVRGGSFQSTPGELRSANRFVVPVGKRREDVGLRVARDLRPDEAGG
ncbi:MAG TPA: SUMF1/EgtB/PvdO family nonheme iron enzyme [Caulobacteraceae bacterium]|nr:SUMF1/EgtB/PvdO family nonheme iron enzyme [Caulobacteraceae bacterium]